MATTAAAHAFAIGTVKLLTTLATLASGVLGCLFPLCVDINRQGARYSIADRVSEATLSRIMSACKCFAGGVVVSLALMHMIPDVEHSFRPVVGAKTSVVVHLIVGCGALSIAVFETMLSPPDTVVVVSTAEPGADVLDHLHSHAQCGGPVEEDPEFRPLVRAHSMPCHPCGRFEDGTHVHKVECGDRSYRDGFEAGVEMGQHLLRREGCVEGGAQCSPATLALREVQWKPALLLAVISLHSVLEGIALGSAQTSESEWTVAIAILAHKAIAGVAIGVAWCRARVSDEVHFLYATLFGFMTPIGSALGWAVSSSLESHAMLFANVAQAVGAGTFLHIGLREFIYDELDNRGQSMSPVAKSLSLAAGFGFMAWIGFIV